MKKLLKSEICGSMNSTLMHCLLQKSQHLRLLFNEQYMNSNHVTLDHVKKKKRTKEQKRSLWNAEVGSVDPNIHLVFVNLWFFGLYLWESYLGVFGIWVCESVSTPICIIPNLLYWNLFVVTRGCRLLPNHIIPGILCLFSFGLVFFVPIVCLEIFLKSKIFSQSILIILCFRYFITPLT